MVTSRRSPKRGEAVAQAQARRRQQFGGGLGGHGLGEAGEGGGQEQATEGEGGKTHQQGRRKGIGILLSAPGPTMRCTAETGILGLTQIFSSGGQEAFTQCGAV